MLKRSGILVVFVAMLAAFVLDIDITACSNIADVDGGGGGGNSDFTTFTVDPVSVNIGESKNLSINISPSDGVTYTAVSGDSSIATVAVNGDGTVTVNGMAAGATTVSVTAKKSDYNNKTVTVPVAVADPSLPDFTKFEIDDVSMNVSGKEDLTIRIDPSDGVTYTATSEDTNTAVVSVNGSKVTVTGKKAGRTRVSVTAAKEGYNPKAVTVDVTVIDPALDFESLSIDPVSMEINESKNLTISITPSAGVTYTATSEDTNTAEVSVNGSEVTVTGKAAGFTPVSVTAKKTGYKDKTVNVPVTVTNPDWYNAYEIYITKGEYDRIEKVEVEYEKKTENLKIQTHPDFLPTVVRFRVTPFDTGIAEVALDGKTFTVEGKAVGTTTVSVTVALVPEARYNPKTVEVPVIVKAVEFTDLTVTPERESVLVGETKDLTASSTPSDGVTYTATSVNTAIATVRAVGNKVKVTGVSAGDTTVKVTAKKAGYNDKTVEIPVKVMKNFTIMPTSVGVGKSKKLTINIATTGWNYEATSADASKVKVTGGSSVTVEGVSPGWTKVKVTAKKDGTTLGPIEVAVAAVDPAQIPKLTMKDIPGKNYLVGESEITREQYAAVIDWAQNTDRSWVVSEYGGYEIEKVYPKPSNDKGPPPEGEEAEKRPVEDVSWYNAVMYCNLLTMMEMGSEECVYDMTDIVYKVSHLSTGDKYYIESANVGRVVGWENKKGYRLPEISEWQYAAKGGQNYKYVGTDDDSKAGDYAWYHPNSGNRVHQVMKKLPNPYGLYDMTGSVFEWCWDTYGDERRRVGGAYNNLYVNALQVEPVPIDSMAPNVAPIDVGIRVVRKK